MIPVAAPVTTNQPFCANRLAKPHGLLVGRRVARRARGAEDRHLPLRTIRCEYGERAAQLAQRLAQNLDVFVRGAAYRQAVGRVPQSAKQIGNLRAVRFEGSLPPRLRENRRRCRSCRTESR